MSENHQHQRFSISDRLEHWILFLSFTSLGITGLVQKFATHNISMRMITMLGGIENVRAIHHIAAIVFCLQAVYHFGVVGYKVFVKRSSLSMLPSTQDVQKGLRAFFYNLGLAKSTSQQGRYTFEEKMEYWALIWGGVIMGLTGFMLWNPIATTQWLPGEWVVAAKVAHGAEAILAVLAIIIWHFYGVHVKSFNKSMFNGKMDEHHMQEEHPLELAQIENNKGSRSATRDAQFTQRRNIYLGVYGVVAITLVGGIYSFVTMETTAITTAPPAEQMQIYVRATGTPAPPTPTPTAPASEPAKEGEEANAEPPAENKPANSAITLTWDGGVGQLFKDQCSACHGTSGGLELSSYASAMKGGINGAVITSGDADKSLLVITLNSDKHAMKFSAADMKIVSDWIKAGAPEK